MSGEERVFCALSLTRPSESPSESNSYTGEIQTGKVDNEVGGQLTDMLLMYSFPCRQEVQQIRNKEAHTALASESSGSSSFRITVCISGLRFPSQSVSSWYFLLNFCFLPLINLSPLY